MLPPSSTVPAEGHITRIGETLGALDAGAFTGTINSMPGKHVTNGGPFKRFGLVKTLLVCAGALLLLSGSLLWWSSRSVVEETKVNCIQGAFLNPPKVGEPASIGTWVSVESVKGGIGDQKQYKACYGPIPEPTATSH
jgi:hypothetical protein